MAMRGPDVSAKYRVSAHLRRHALALSLGRDRLIAAVTPPARARVMEIGCGTGRN